MPGRYRRLPIEHLLMPRCRMVPPPPVMMLQRRSLHDDGHDTASTMLGGMSIFECSPCSPSNRCLLHTSDSQHLYITRYLRRDDIIDAAPDGGEISHAGTPPEMNTAYTTSPRILFFSFAGEERIFSVVYGFAISPRCSLLKKTPDCHASRCNVIQLPA